jgi:hypothetical protein
VSFLLCRCGDKNENEYITSSTKEFLMFEKGSNWLYREDSTGNEQYFYVDQLNLSTKVNQIDEITYKNESIGILLKSMDSSACYLVIDPYSFGIEESFGNKYKSYFYTANYNGFCFTTNKLKDTTILGILYKDVSHVVDKVRYADSKDYFTNEYWIAKNKWVIKKILRTPTGNWYWSLKKCKIFQ